MQYYLLFGQNKGWVKLDPQSEFKIDMNRPETLHQYSSFINTP